MSKTKDRVLLLKRSHMGDQCLDFVVTQLVLEGLHLLLAVFLQAVLDRSEHLVVFQARLVLRVRLVLDARHASGLGLALTVLAVAGGTMFGPVGRGIRGPGGASEDKRNQSCTEEKQFFHG